MADSGNFEVGNGAINLGRFSGFMNGSTGNAIGGIGSGNEILFGNFAIANNKGVYVADGPRQDIVASASTLHWTVTGSKGSDFIMAGDAGMTVKSSAGADILVFGKGADVFEFTSNLTDKTFINQYDSKNDKIKLNQTGFDSFKAASVAYDGNNVEVKFGDSGNVVFANAKNANNTYSVSMVDNKDAKKTVAWYNATDTAANDYIFTVDADEYVAKVKGNNWLDATAAGVKEVNLSGNKYLNINNVVGGGVAGDWKLTGSSRGSSVVSMDKPATPEEYAKINATLTGGSIHNDTLIGGGNKDTFVFGIGDGKDLVQKVDFANDTIFFSKQPTVVNAGRDAKDQVVISMGTDTLTFEGTAEQTIQQVRVKNEKLGLLAAIGSDKKDNTFNVNVDDKEFARAFYGSANQNNEIVISGNKKVEMWLDNRKVATDGAWYGNIDKVNATNMSGETLIAGNDRNNVLTAATGKSSLWGGAGVASDDTLVGGASADVFYYGVAEGRDVIQKGDALDKVMLYTPGFETKIATAGLKGSDLVIAMNDNSSLTIKAWSKDSLNTFELANGDKYGFDGVSKMVKK